MGLYTHSNIFELRYLLLIYFVRAYHAPDTILGFCDLSVSTADKRSPQKKVNDRFLHSFHYMSGNNCRDIIVNITSNIQSISQVPKLGIKSVMWRVLGGTHTRLVETGGKRNTCKQGIKTQSRSISKVQEHIEGLSDFRVLESLQSILEKRCLGQGSS